MSSGPSINLTVGPFIFDPEGFRFRAPGMKGRAVEVLLGIGVFLPLLAIFCTQFAMSFVHKSDYKGLIQMSVKLCHFFEITHMDWNWKATQKPETTIFKIQDNSFKSG